MYLHEAIRQVIQEGGNMPMTIEDIARAINRRQLYVKRDGSAVDARQVALRAAGDVAKGNPPQFDVLIRLRDAR